MISLKEDLSGFEKVNLDMPPVGVRFQYSKPEGIDQLEMGRKLSFCEMLREAQKSDKPFYIGETNDQACIGKILLGMEEIRPKAESGDTGARLGIFQQPRANYLTSRNLPKFSKGVVNYVAFSRLEKLAFDPDVLIIAATARQGEIILRSMTYTTGEMYISRTTPIAGCAWLYIYPFQSGNVNYLMPDMIHGMRGRELFPESTVLISIPFHWIPAMARNLREMKINLQSHEGRDKYLAEIKDVMG